MKTSLFFRKKLSPGKVRLFAKKEQNAIRLRMKKLEESLIFLDFLISSQFVKDETDGDMSFLLWESPDFLVQMRKKKVGVELTRAVRLHPEPRGGHIETDAAADPLRQWHDAIVLRIAKKMRKYAKGTIRLFNRNVLVVLDEVPLAIDDALVPELIESVASTLTDCMKDGPNVMVCVKARRRHWWRLARDKGGVWRGVPFSKERTGG